MTAGHYITATTATVALLLTITRCAMIPEPVMTKTQIDQTQVQAKYLGWGWVKR